MKTKKALNKALEYIDIWQNELDKYEYEQLLKKSSADSWSLGQVYMHLINATLEFHLKQVEICMQSDENSAEKKNFKGIMTYHILGKMPPIRISVPPSESYTPKQPESKEQISAGLQEVKRAMENTCLLLEKSSAKGKVQHPGFSFLNADEWFQLVGMHFQHHLRQKERINN